MNQGKISTGQQPPAFHTLHLSMPLPAVPAKLPHLCCNTQRPTPARGSRSTCHKRIAAGCRQQSRHVASTTAVEARCQHGSTDRNAAGRPTHVSSTGLAALCTHRTGEPAAEPPTRRPRRRQTYVGTTTTTTTTTTTNVRRDDNDDDDDDNDDDSDDDKRTSGRQRTRQQELAARAPETERRTETNADTRGTPRTYHRRGARRVLSATRSAVGVPRLRWNTRARPPRMSPAGKHA